MGVYGVGVKHGRREAEVQGLRERSLGAPGTGCSAIQVREVREGVSSSDGGSKEKMIRRDLR